MHLFYIDEAGCLGVLPTVNSQIQPVFVVAGIIISQRSLEQFTWDFLNLKKSFYPNLKPKSGEFLDWIKVEIKGSDLRKQIRDTSRDKRRHALGVLDKFLSILEHYEARIAGRIMIKGIAAPIDGVAYYSSAAQIMGKTFQKFLESTDDEGMMILDSRNKNLNTPVSHSIFTQKFRHAGDAYSRILDMPLFGHSDNHAGIQAADLLCSGFLFPMAAYVYCWGHLTTDHAHYNYTFIRDKFGERLKRLQFRYEDAPHWSGGITVGDKLKKQTSALLFGPLKAKSTT